MASPHPANQLAAEWSDGYICRSIPKTCDNFLQPGILFHALPGYNLLLPLDSERESAKRAVKSCVGTLLPSLLSAESRSSGGFIARGRRY